MKVYNPCRECTKRQIGCHSTCPGYKTYLEERKAEIERIQQAKKADTLADSYEERKARRLARKK